MTVSSGNLRDLGNDCFGYVQLDGGWGLSNAGLISDNEESLLIDTLQGLGNCVEMITQMRRATRAADQIGRVVNTHAHSDHNRGNQFFPDVEIIASRTTIAEMECHASRPTSDLRANWRSHGDAGKFIHHIMRGAEDQGNAATLPTVGFEGRLDLRVGDKLVELHEFPKVHSASDVIVYSPKDRTVFTGDLLFHHVHPIIGGGPVQNWIDACDRMLSWDLETVVPGHGPITDKSGIRKLRHYLCFIRDEATKRYHAGMKVEDAARDITLDAFRGWPDEERIVANVLAIYKELGDREALATSFADSAAMMGRYLFDHCGAKFCP